MSELPPYPPPSSPPPSSPPPSFSPPEPPGDARPSRAPVVALAVIGVAIIAALAVAVPLLVTEDPAPRDLSAVRAYRDLPVEHTAEDVDYPQSPAVGGPHDPMWLDCGAYDEPVREENAVHDLEHGSVWISYDPRLDDEDVDRLAEALPQNGILAPYPDLDAPVVVTVWGRQLDLLGADDARLKLFIRRYGGGVTAPEPFASCAGGTADPGGDSGSGAEV